jgi:hypothetical protein
MARAAYPAGRGITMSFLTAFFYDRVMAKTEAACLRQWRGELLAQVSGEVLEIGAGTGANITLYSDRVKRLTLTPTTIRRGSAYPKATRKTSSPKTNPSTMS